MTKKQRKKLNKLIITLVIIVVALIIGFSQGKENQVLEDIKTSILGITETKSYDIGDIPEYNGKPYITINNNKPNFKEEEKTTKLFEKYSNLDSLNRCGVAYANVSKETMPTEKRGRIGMIKKSGWHTIKYDNVY